VTDGPDSPEVSFDREGAIWTIALRRPALTDSAKRALLTSLQESSADPEVRVIVLTGSDRVFCTGEDLRGHADRLRADPDGAFAILEELYNPIVTAIVEAPKPVIAAINGTCAGAGIALALACDVRVAVSTAKFVPAFTAVGLSFDSGLSASLTRTVGAARASEMMLLGEAVGAPQALAWGLVGRLCEPDELVGVTSEIASRLGSGPTLAYAATKRAIRAAWAPLPEILRGEAEAQRALGRTNDHRAAVEAFLNKETPKFTGS
jgi:2-(1,2-epoxy-1,2-dihydrophenyl)acetyl-CoA isomerase